MTVHGEQVNTYGADPVGLFFIDATMLGLPLDLLHIWGLRTLVFMVLTRGSSRYVVSGPG
jgi:hypothetical protein